ncbi:hypothetical protein ACNFR7_11950 [Streptomyces sp. RM1]
MGLGERVQRLAAGPGAPGIEFLALRGRVISAERLVSAQDSMSRTKKSGSTAHRSTSVSSRTDSLVTAAHCRRPLIRLLLITLIGARLGRVTHRGVGLLGANLLTRS